MSDWNITFSLVFGGGTLALLLLLIFDWTRATAWLKWLVAVYMAGPPA